MDSAAKDLQPLIISKVFVIGIAEWMYEYTTLEDAAAGIYQLDKKVKEEGVKLDYVEVRIEFTSGESERCAFRDKERVFEWLRRFDNKSAG